MTQTQARILMYLVATKANLNPIQDKALFRRLERSEIARDLRFMSTQLAELVGAGLVIRNNMGLYSASELTAKVLIADVRIEFAIQNGA